MESGKFLTTGSSMRKLFLLVTLSLLSSFTIFAQGNNGNCESGKACAYTPGFYGSAGGNTCDGQSTTDVINIYLDDEDLVVGRGSKTMTFTAGDANCVYDLMPGGGTPDAIQSGPNTCGNVTGIPLDNQGKFDNVLVGQTVALSFNTRISPELGLVPVVDSLVIQDINCNGNHTGPEEDWFIPEAVVDYLGSGANVLDLLDLANDALGGVYVPSGTNPTYSEINDAVDAYNNMFNECQILVYPAPPTSVTIDVSGTNLLCNGDNSGTVSVDIQGGNYPWDIEWSTGATTATVSGLAAGTYSVTVTDVDGCTGTGSVTITEPAALTASVTGTNLLCNGDNSGSADLSVSGGTAPYSYDWSNGETTEDISGLGAGTYSVTVTDNNGCSESVSVTLAEPDELVVASIDGTDPLCNGDANGSVDLEVSGGTSPLSYSWSNGATTEDLSGLSAGTYSVTVTDDNGCTVDASITLDEPDELTATISGSDLDCHGDNSGSADLTVSGGTAPYSYDWSNGATTEDLTGLAAGTYSVTVTDDNNCTATASVTLTEPDELTATVVGTNVLIHGNSTGSADLTVTGGTTPYSYLWSNGATTEDISGLAAGTYSVTVTDANGCTATASVTITQPDPLVAVIAGTDLDCYMDMSGEADLTVTGGVTPYTYSWSNGATTEDLTGLAAGTYSVTVTDVHGATATASVTISQPADLTASISGTNLDCNGDNSGSADLTVSGGTSPYSYDWSNGATTEDISGLAAGTYSVTVTDDNGCEVTASVTITEPPAVAASAVGTDLVCHNDNSGSADLTASGGTPPYSYSWSNGATTEDLSGIAAGTYTVTVTDDNGCEAITSVTINEPAELTANIVTTEPLCNGDANGEADLTVSGGTAPYTYSWSNGATTEDLTGLTAGTYSVTVTDDNNCTATASVTISEPDVLSASIVGTNVLIHGNSTGSADLTVTGGTTPYSYLWSNGATTEDISGLAAGTYSVTVTDANGCTATASVTITQPDPLVAVIAGTDLDCYMDMSGEADLTVTGGVTPYTYDWSNGATTEDLTGLAAGTYSVTVTDTHGATATASVTITQPADLTASISGTNLDCNGDNSGSADLTVSGGTSPYSYDWSNGATTEDISGLAAGTYSVTVTDDNGCEVTATVTITEPDVLAANAVGTDLACNGDNSGSVDLTVSGGTSPYSYDWSNGATTEDLSGVAAGTYSVTVTDDNGCSTTASATIGEPAVLSASISGTDLACNGDNSGEADLTVSGGTSPYSYDWSNGATSEDLTGLAAGTYSVTVTDDNGCEATASVTISEPSTLTASISGTDPGCNGGTNGAADLTASGGTAPYTYSWSNGATTEDLSGLSAGTYSVTVTDDNGCEATASITLVEPLELTASINGTDVLCNGGTSGEADLTATGGTAPYSYDWSNGATTEDLTGLAAGTYSVTVTDANNCSGTGSVTIDEPTALSLSITATGCTCNGSNDGSADLTVTGGTPAYSYSWSNGATTEDISGLAAGFYTVTVTDANGCTETATVEITEPDAIDLSAIGGGSDQSNISCYGAEDGEIVLTPQGGTGSYTYSWSNGSTSATLTGLAEGIYFVTVSDDNGCTAAAAFAIEEPDLLVGGDIEASNDNPICGSDDNTLTASPTGGTAPFTYSWSVSGDGWSIVSGADEATMTFSTGAFGVTGTFTVVVTDANGCTDESSISLDCDAGGAYCGFTPGFWGGSENSQECSGENTMDMISDALTTDLKIGWGSTYELTFVHADTQCLHDRMPGGGPSTKIDDGPNTCDNVIGIDLKSDGRFANALVSHVVALSLNVRHDPNLANMVIEGTTLTTAEAEQCNDFNASCVPGTEETWTIPNKVVDFLGSGATVSDLLTLANKALGGNYVPHGPNKPSLSQLTTALTAINEGFVECRVVVGWSGSSKSGGYTDYSPAQSKETNIFVFPNPFAEQTMFNFTVANDDQVRLEVYNIYGQLVATPFNGEVAAGAVNVVTLNANDLTNGTYMYVLRTSTEVMQGKITLTK